MHQGLFSFDGAYEPPDREAEGAGREEPLSLDEQWEQFRSRHPDVLRLFKAYARELRASGRRKAGAKAIIERLRWDYMTSAHGTESPALNNNIVSRLSRWLMDDSPGEFAGFFETRKLRSTYNKDDGDED